MYALPIIIQTVEKYLYLGYNVLVYLVKAFLLPIYDSLLKGCIYNVALHLCISLFSEAYFANYMALKPSEIAIWCIVRSNGAL